MHDKFKTRPNRGGRGYYRKSHRENIVPVNRDESFYDGLFPSRTKGWRNWPNYNYHYFYRWLRKQIGRPWDKVFSEIAREYDRRSIERLDIERYLRHAIHLHCFVDESGEIRSYSRYNGDPSNGDYFGKADGLYVHPKTGLLCYRHVDNPWGYKREREPITRIPLNDGTWFQLIECSPERGPYYKFDAWFHCWEEKTQRRVFEPISDWHLKDVERSIDPDFQYYSMYKGMTLEGALRLKGYALFDRKGQQVWGKYVNETDTKLTKKFCNNAEREWIEKYLAQAKQEGWQSGLSRRSRKPECPVKAPEVQILSLPPSTCSSYG